MKTLLKILLPFLVLALGALGARELANSRKVPEPTPREVPIPRVRTIAAELISHQVQVPSQGIVISRTESELMTEVPGRVVHVSPSLINGGFFEADDVLLRIDPRDFELVVIQAELDVARAKRRLSEEEADARVALSEWESMGQGEASDLALHKPQIEEAKASLKAAEAMHEKAQRDLGRTILVAPYRGRVRRKSVDLGQFVTLGAPLATLYAIDIAEVRLPLSDGELAFLELPFGSAEEQRERRPLVQLSSNFAGKEYHWPARIVRTEGEIDPKTRMVIAVAEVIDPYGQERLEQGIPLALGMFVRADITGVVLENVLVLPRTALRDGDQLYVVNDQDRVHFVGATVIRTERNSVIVRAEIEAGTRIVISPLEIVTEGMQVRDVANDPPAARTQNGSERGASQ